MARERRLLASIYKEYEYEYELIEELEDENIDKLETENIVKFKVNKKFLDIYSDKKESEYNEEYGISEEDEWKVYRLEEDFDIDKKIASIYNTLGWMYYEGKGESIDINRSIEIFSKSLEYNDIYLYNYSLASALIGANRYDEAMESANKVLSQIEEDNAENKDMLSNTYKLIGVIYLEQYEDDLAKQNCEKAIELNPNNQYAITNLNSLK